MMGYRSFCIQHQPQMRVLEDTVSIIDNGQVIPYKGMIYGLYANNATFNEPVNLTFGENVNRCANLFSMCYEFNQNVVLPDTLEDCFGMFFGCRNLNQNIKLPNNLKHAEGMFKSCFNLNQNIQIPYGTENCYEMFSGCRNLNQNIAIPNTVTNISYMFNGCSNLKQDEIHIPASVCTTAYAFANCNSLYETVFTIDGKLLYNVGYTFFGINAPLVLIFTNRDPTNFTVSGLLGWTKNNAFRTTIMFNNSLDSVFKNASAPIVGSSAITWTAMTNGNGFYNSYYNIYCRNTL